MNTLEKVSRAESAIWHDRMLQGCEEVIRGLTTVLLRLKQNELKTFDRTLSLTVFIECAE